MDGTFYFGNGNKFYAFTRSGVKKWDYTAGGEIKSTAAIGADGIIYFGSADGRINMLNRSGTLVGWFDAGSAIQGSPTLAPNGMLYFGAADGKLYGLETGSPRLAHVYARPPAYRAGRQKNCPTLPEFAVIRELR
jgi:outer membrane protein assembly factor BamB